QDHPRLAGTSKCENKSDVPLPAPVFDDYRFGRDINFIEFISPFDRSAESQPPFFFIGQFWWFRAPLDQSVEIDKTNFYWSFTVVLITHTTSMDSVNHRLFA